MVMMMMMAWDGDNDDDGRGAVVVAVAVAVSIVFLFFPGGPRQSKKNRFLHMAADATQPSLPQSSSHQHALRRRSPRRRCAPQAGVG